MKEIDTFFEYIYITGMPSDLTATKLLPLTLSNGEIMFSSILPLCWVGLSFNIVFSGRGTIKMLLINISGTEQIFAYWLQLPAGLCFDFGISSELMS